MDKAMPFAHTRTLDSTVHFRCTSAQKEAIKTRAKACDMSITDFGIWAMTKQDLKVFAIEQKLLFELRTELARQGNNINQIAHSLNSILATRNDSRNRSDLMDLVEDCCNMILRLNQEQIAAYHKVGKIQSKIYEANVESLLKG